MNTDWRYFRKGLWILAAFTLFAGTVGCERTPEQKLKQARVELVQGNPERAKSYLSDVLKAKPNSHLAKRLMADVQDQLGNYAKAEQQLDEVWKKLGLDKKKPSELSSGLSKEKKLIEQQYESVYENWMKSLDPAKDSETYRNVANRALKTFPSDKKVNELAYKYYNSRAKKLAEDEKYKEAATLMEELAGLEPSEQTANEAKRRANDFRFQIHKEDSLKYFNENAKAKLEEEGIYKPKNKMIELNIEQKVNKKLDPDNDKHRKAAKALAIKAMGKRLQQLLVEAAGLSKDTDFSNLQTPDELEITDQNFEKGVFKLKADLPLNALLRLGFELQQSEK